MTKHYPVEQRERAVKMVLDHLDEYGSVYAACQVIGPKVGVGYEWLRRWVLQAHVDANERPGATTAEQQRIKELEREVRSAERPPPLLRDPGGRRLRRRRRTETAGRPDSPVVSLPHHPDQPRRPARAPELDAVPVGRNGRDTVDFPAHRRRPRLELSTRARHPQQHRRRRPRLPLRRHQSGRDVLNAITAKIPG